MSVLHQLPKSYHISFVIAMTWHLLLAMVLFSHVTTKNPALELSQQNQANPALPTVIPMQAETQPIKAVSIDQQAVQQTINRLQATRQQQRLAEENRQHALARQAQYMRQQREAEQQRLQQLKRETEKLAQERAKKIKEEQQHLKVLAEEKAQEEHRLKEIKQQQQALQAQQQLALKRLAETKTLHEKQQLHEKQVQDEQRQKLEKKAAEQAKAHALAAQRARESAAKLASIAGEVDKYKALILSAIGRQWILPDNVNKQLSSQFHIRLAPNGTVLEVSLIKSSGDSILDRSAQSAIYKASPLPVPVDPTSFDVFREINLTVRPESIRG